MALDREEYAKYTDEELVAQIRQGNADMMEYLLQKYKSQVRKIANHFFLIRADKEDLIQEGMIGLFKAIRAFDDSQNCSFYSFAVLCIRAEMQTAIRRSLSRKHQPLNNYLPIGTESDEDEVVRLETLAASGGANVNPEQLALDQEFFQTVFSQLREQLSATEWDVLELFFQGMLRADIAQQLGMSQKSVDNALWRARQKVSQLLNGMSV